jgi:hypothetical protein
MERIQKLEALKKRIEAAAKRDARLRRDARYLGVLGFLAAKGLLTTNQDVRARARRRIQIEDAIWAGKNVEPRILEVLPAAVMRFPKNFEYTRNVPRELAGIVDLLKARREEGPDFLGIPFAKLRVWADLRLADRRTKPVAEKKIMRTFRLTPAVVCRLQELARETGCTLTEALERALIGR